MHASQILYHWAVPPALRCTIKVFFNVPWILNFETILFSLFQRLDLKSKDISKIAADITQAISLSQGIERKKVIQHIRGMYKVDLSASRHWQELIQQLTHDRCVLGTRLGSAFVCDVNHCFHYKIQIYKLFKETFLSNYQFLIFKNNHEAFLILEEKYVSSSSFR